MKPGKGLGPCALEMPHTLDLASTNSSSVRSMVGVSTTGQHPLFTESINWCVSKSDAFVKDNIGLVDPAPSPSPLLASKGTRVPCCVISLISLTCSIRHSHHSQLLWQTVCSPLAVPSCSWIACRYQPLYLRRTQSAPPQQPHP